MKIKLILFVSSIFLISCTKKVNKADLKYLNGFWEIKHVETEDGKKVDYKINLTVDNFEIDTINFNSGLRKKGMPQLDGSYLTNNVEEVFTIADSSGILKLNYKTKYTKWSEDILTLTENDFVVRNENNVIYTYKRYQPIDLN